jgi:uncharacterized protein YbaA (DUF1428 family)
MLIQLEDNESYYFNPKYVSVMRSYTHKDDDCGSTFFRIALRTAQDRVYAFSWTNKKERDAEYAKMVKAVEEYNTENKENNDCD